VGSARAFGSPPGPSATFIRMFVFLSPLALTATDWAGVQAIVLSVAAAVAIWQVWEARRLRRAQAQPFVVVDFEVLEAQQQIYIVISNIGTTTARDVQLRFEPPLSSSFDSKPNITPPRELKPLSDRIPSLPPGKQIRVLFDIFTERGEAAYPDVFRAEITFYSPALKRNFSADAVSTSACTEEPCTQSDVTSTTSTSSLERSLARSPGGLTLMASA
jgi:hypothetical protein